MPPSTTRITMVRMKVAKSELICSMPILAKMAVKAAKTAESRAQKGHDRRMGFTVASSV
jgi:hypothetical protein